MTFTQRAGFAHGTVRFTPDVRRITDGSLAVRVKYAFAQFDNVLNARPWIRFGLHQSPWLDFEESVNRCCGLADGFRVSLFYSAGWYAADRPVSPASSVTMRPIQNPPSGTTRRGGSLPAAPVEF